MSKEEAERVFGEATDKWVQTFSQLVPLEQLDVGIGLAGGQIRLLAEDQVQEALKGFQQVPPTNPIDVTLWNSNLADQGLPPTLYSPYPPFSSSPSCQEGGPEWPAWGGCPEYHQEGVPCEGPPTP